MVKNRDGSRDANTQVLFTDVFWSDGKKLLEVGHCSSNRVVSPAPIWMRPLFCKLELNLDAFIKKGDGFISFGQLYREHLGIVLAACSTRLVGSFPPKMT